MPRTYTVDVEVIRAYVIEVEASTASEAMQKVDNMTPICRTLWNSSKSMYSLT